jgi:hypothetical protein
LGSGASGQIKLSTCILTLTSQFLGVAELLIFHPVDTVAKRLMSNKAKVLCRTLTNCG